MSFGFSPSDIVALINLASKAYQGWKKACGEYADVTASLDNLLIILTRIESETAKPESILVRSVDDATDLTKILASTLPTVRELNGVVKQYKSLSLGKSREKNWDRIRFGIKDLTELRLKLNQHVIAITAYLETVGLGALSRIERGLETLPQIKHTIDALAADIRAGRREASVLTTYDDDDKEVWRQFRRELVGEGMRSSTIHKYKPQIKDYLRTLAGTGLLEEDALGEDECRKDMFEIEAFEDEALEKDALDDQRTTPRVPFDSITVSSSCIQAAEALVAVPDAQTPLHLVAITGGDQAAGVISVPEVYDSTQGGAHLVHSPPRSHQAYVEDCDEDGDNDHACPVVDQEQGGVYIRDELADGPPESDLRETHGDANDHHDCRITDQQPDDVGAGDGPTYRFSNGNLQETAEAVTYGNVMPQYVTRDQKGCFVSSRLQARFIVGEEGTCYRLPLFPKVHRDNVSKELLTSRLINFERDKVDSQFIIILKEIGWNEVCLLINHTPRRQHDFADSLSTPSRPSPNPFEPLSENGINVPSETMRRDPCSFSSDSIFSSESDFEQQQAPKSYRGRERKTKTKEVPRSASSSCNSLKGQPATVRSPSVSSMAATQGHNDSYHRSERNTGRPPKFAGGLFTVSPSPPRHRSRSSSSDEDTAERCSHSATELCWHNWSKERTPPDDTAARAGDSAKDLRLRDRLAACEGF
ncbi:hypothetical protein LTR10_008445 [Elasticomyces elasticus]|nr:hypothetical protein LTR10_008445 [Elasticomyces elasticus]KAK4967317.1 hypothetical protein LTR42_010666 [Elasticomyces elasticus]